ncbi:immunoglobulin domain-containing protein [Ancylomarina longa]|nr:immunoglobulin domain-containing protein [Ancylomarina longa]
MRNGKIFTHVQIVFKFIFVFTLFALPLKGIAQYDYEHFVPPFYDGSSTDNDIGYHEAILSTNSIKDVKVYIYKGYSDILDSVIIKQGTPGIYKFKTSKGGTKGDVIHYPDSYTFPKNVVGAKELNKVLPDDGIRFFSSNAPFFVNIRHSTKDQGLSLTTKGTYAYGTDFLSGHVYTSGNSAISRRSHFVSVMATEDNTVVNFSDIKVSMLTEYNATTKSLEATSISSDSVITQTLMKGQSYVIAVDHDLPGFSDADKNAMNGTSITSTKPIVVNTGSWTSGPYRAGQDIGVDQIVPIDQLRNEYIVMRGKGNSSTERPVVVATEDNTEVKVNGVLKGTIAKKGEYLALADPYDGNGNAYILADKNIYVYQTLSGSSSRIGPTVGMNFIPPVSTSGIREVTVPYAELLAEQGVNGVITILAQTGAVISYSRNGEETLHPLSDIANNPVNISGVPQWEIYKLSNNLTGSYRFYSNKAINVAWLVESGVVGAAGYYSGFTKAISKIIPDLGVNIDANLDLICESYDDNISVSIKDPLPDFYEWYVNDFTKRSIIVNGSLDVPAPDVETTYYVVGSYRDPLMDQLYNGSFFELSANSDYAEVYRNLRNPGEYTIDRQTTDADPSFKNPSFTDMDNDYMLMAISKERGDTIYRGTSVDVVKGFNYIVKLFGRKMVNAEFTADQSLQVLVNGDTIIDNFTLNDPTVWQSASALWKPGNAANAIIKICNNNAVGIQSAFALDSITFVQAVQDTAAFVARVVPNYSYGNNGDTFHFCEGTQNSLDVSNGDTSWYDYSWAKNDGTGTYVDLSDNAEFSGTKTFKLIFLNPQQGNEGDYRCTIGFKPDYQQCGNSDSNVNVDLHVLVDKPAGVTLTADKTNFCYGTTAFISALVTGDAGAVKWFVNGGSDPVSVENPYVFPNTYAAGTYAVKCQAENGCGIASDNIDLNVLSAPNLTDLTVNPDLCEGHDVILTASATGNEVLNYNWKRGTTDLSEHGASLTFPASMTNRSDIFSVSVSSIYTVGAETIVCPDNNSLTLSDLDILPLVTIQKGIDDVTLCEGTASHTFSVETTEAESFYNYTWLKDGNPQPDASSQKIISPITIGDDGVYKVSVSNRCDTKESTATLSVTPKLVVNDITIDKTGPFCDPTNVVVTFDDNGAVSAYKAKKPDGTIIDITPVGNPYSFEINDDSQGVWEFIVDPNCGGSSVSREFTLNMIPVFGNVSMNDNSACIGNDINFTVDINNIPAASILTYEWKDNNDIIVGGNSSSLALTNIQESNEGTYTCKVTDQCGRSKMANANLSIEKVNTSSTAAAIVKCVGDTDFRIDIDYVGTPTFAWRFNDPNGAIIGTNDFFALASVSKTDEGIYYCTVNLPCGDQIKIERKLVVNEHISIVNPADETINICQGEQPVLKVEVNGNTDDYTIQWTNASDVDLGFGDVNQIQLPKSTTPGTYTYKAKVDGFCDNLVKNYIVQVHEKPILTSADNSVEVCSGLVNLTITESGEHNDIEWWKDGALITDGNADQTNFVIDPAASPSDDGTYIAKANSDYCGNDQISINLDVRNTIVVTNQSTAVNTVCEGALVNLFVIATGDNIEYKWYKSTDPATILSDQPNLDLGNVSLAQGGEYKCDIFNDLHCGDQTLTFNVIVNKNPSVTPPSDQMICETQGSVDFVVTGDAQGTINYQWFDKDDIAVGTNSSTLTVVPPVDGQSYYCVVSGNACGTAISGKANLTVVNEVTVSNPLDQEIADGADATFSVTASGEPNYTYQWQVLDGTWKDITGVDKYSGTKSDELKITNADKATYDGNQYRCVVESSGAICASTATSNAATLTISSVIKIASNPTNAIACDGVDVDLTIEGYFDTLSYKWEYDDGSGYQDADDFGMSASTVEKISTLTIPSVNTGMNAWKFRCLVSDGSSTDEYSNEVSIRVLEDIVVSSADAIYTPCVNDLFSISVTATAGDDIKYKWYKVGDESNILSSSATLNIGNIILSDNGDYKCEIYNEQHCHDVTKTFTIDVKEHATVTNPLNVTMCANDADPVFTVAGTAEGIVNYQWYDKDDNPVGTNAGSYTVTSPANGQNFYAVVSGDFCDDATSDRAGLTVLNEVTVTDPVDVIIADGGTANFEVTASGEPIYYYQWQEDSGSGFTDLANGGVYSGVNTAKLTITGALIGSFDGNKYQCIVTSSSCSGVATSNPALLTIDAVIKISVQPSNQKVCEGTGGVLEITGSKAGMTYTWQYDDGSGTFVNAVGNDGMFDAVVGNVSSLTIPNANTGMNSWTFKCIVYYLSFTPDESNIVNLQVMENISVSTPSNNSPSVCDGTPTVLSVVATGTDVNYKWYIDGASGTVLSTSSDLDLGNVHVSDEALYKCDVYNELNCNDQTISFDLDVKELATASTLLDEEMCSTDTPPTFSVIAGGDGPYTYQWYNNGGIISGETSDSYTVGSPVDGQSYYCEVSNGCNSVNSNAAVLTVHEEVAIVSQPIDNNIVDGANAEFTVSVSGEPMITYQWQEDSGSGFTNLSDGGDFSGTDAATLTISGVNKAGFDGNTYRCIVDNGCAVAQTSDEVNLTVNALIKIFAQPQNLKACLNDAVDFVITGTSDGLDYAWEYDDGSGIFVNAEGVFGMSDIPITNGSKLHISNTTLAMGSWTFRCIVSDGSSTDEISNLATLSVFEPVSFDPISNQNLCSGVSKQIELTHLTGTGDLTYSWKQDGTEVSTTNLVNISDLDNGAYNINVSNGVCPDLSNDFIVSHYSKLSIDTWSNIDKLCIGNTKTLSATVTVDPALEATTTYEWFKDEVSLGTTMDANYSLVATEKGQSGQYKLVVNDGCSTETVSGYINIYEPIVSNNVWPASDTLCVGEELNLEAKVSGDASSYTWTHNGTALTATTNYLVSEVTSTDAGVYKCVVTDECGIEITYSIEITILSIPQITTGIDAIPSVCEGESLELGPIASTPYDDLVWTLNDESTNNTAGLSLDLGNASLSQEGNYKVTVSNICGSDISVGHQVVNPIPVLEPIPNQEACQDDDVIFRAKATGRNLNYQWFIDDVDQNVNNEEFIMDAIKVVPEDEFTAKVYNIKCVISSPDACGTDEQTATLTVNPSTVLHATLTNKVKYVGDNYTMSLAISGADLEYHWTHEVDGVKTELTDITGPSIDFTDIQMSDAGYYNCRIIGTCGQRLASGKLTVKEPVKVDSELSSMEEKCEGEPLSLSLQLSGQVDSVKWFKDDVLLSKDELNLYIPELTLDDAGKYFYKVYGEGVDVIEHLTTVRVYPLTSLNAPLGNQTICEGDELTWSPDISGADDLNYVWSFNGTEVYHEKLLSFDAVTLAQEGDYEVQVTGLCGDVSTSGKLEVTKLPVFISASESKSVCENTSSVEFTAEFEGENLKYEWRKNELVIPGQTAPVLKLTNIQLDDGGVYTCRAYSNCGESISSEINLTVIPQLVINSELVDTEVCDGEEVAFTTDVVGNNVSYQWKKDGVNIDGAVNANLNFTPASPDDNGYYTCVVSDDCTDSRSTKPTELTVHKLPNTEIFGRMVLCAKEDRVTYVTIDQPDITYGWGVDGGIFAGPEEGVRTRITWEEVANGQLSVTISDLETGCESKVDSLVTLNALPNVNLSTYPSKGVCESAFELTGGYPEGGIYWVDGISQKVFDPSGKGPGNYNIFYTYTDNNGCSNVSTTTNLRVDTLPVVDITDDVTVGNCKPFQLNAVTKEDNILWSPADNLDNANVMNPIFTPGKSQVIVASVKDEHACVGIDLVNLNVAALPEVKTINDTIVSQCNQLELTTDIVGDLDKISWTNAEQLDDPDTRSPHIVNAPEGTYTYKISVTDLYGCDATDEVIVQMVADPKLEEDKFACEGEQFEVNVSGMENPVWEDGYAEESRTISAPGKYLLEVSNKYGCGDEQNFVINPTPALNLKDTLIFDGETVILGANLPSEFAPYFFEWQDGSILPRLEVSETGKYTLKVVDNLGCTALDSAYVEVKPVGIESPSAFTPKSNNENDKFYLKDINVAEQFEMYVYDRWGELLFQSHETGYNGGWDGTYKGKLCPTGAYVWVAFINGKLTNKGTFVLVR